MVFSPINVGDMDLAILDVRDAADPEINVQEY